VLGPADAPATLLEYADFQCPYCGDAYPVVNPLLDRFPGRLRFVFRHMPLPDLHPRAQVAAEAAEAAAAQGRFWEMHARLFENQLRLGDRDLRDHAEAVGVADLERFAAELREGVHAARVEADFQSGVRSGVPSTPRFFVNGVIHLGSPSFGELSEAISRELNFVVA
jgi:NhaA family Na+:H+ antiporter